MKCEYIVNTGICAVSMYEFPLCFAVWLIHVLQMTRLTVTFDRQCHVYMKEINRFYFIMCKILVLLTLFKLNCHSEYF